jgi:predicted transporter
MTVLYVFLICFAAIYALWIFFICVMGLQRARDAGLLSKTARVLGTPVLIVGYLLDAFVNIVVMTVVLLELPQELTVTYRLKRHLQESTGWRLNVAKWFIPLLDPYDPSGKHL